MCVVLFLVVQQSDAMDDEEVVSPLEPPSTSPLMADHIRRGLTHSETTDGVNLSSGCISPQPPSYQSARAWMWSRGGAAAGGKRALSEQSAGDGHHNHLWHPPSGLCQRTGCKRISAPLVRAYLLFLIVSLVFIAIIVGSNLSKWNLNTHTHKKKEFIDSP